MLQFNRARSSGRAAHSPAGVATMPAGAAILAYVDQADTSSARKVIPNSVTAQAPIPNLLPYSRDLGSTTDFATSSATLTARAAANQFGETTAFQVAGTGGSWNYHCFSLILPAGVYTMACDVKRVGGSDQSFALSAFPSGGTQSGTKTAGASWSRASHTWTSTGGSTSFYWGVGVGPDATYLCDNVGVFAGAVDLGAENPVGHVYMGYDAFTAVPTISSNYATLSSSSGYISLLRSLAGTAGDFTWVFLTAKNGAGVDTSKSLVGSYFTTKTYVGDGYGGMQARIENTAYSGSQVLGGAFARNGENFHVRVLRRSGSTLSVFLDGLLMDTYTGISTAIDLSDLTFGNWVRFKYSDHKINTFGLYLSALSDAQIATIFSALKSRAAGLSPAIPMDTARHILCVEGDSITIGAFVTSGYVQTFWDNANSGLYGTNHAVSGAHLATGVVAREAAALAVLPSVKEAGFKSIYYAMIGVNDGFTDGTSPASYAASLGAHFARMKAGGFDYCVASTGLPCTNATTQTNRNILNPIITGSTWKTTYGVDATVDYGSNPTIGADAAASNTTYYGDGTHPTQAGHDLLEPIFRAVINAL